MIDEKNLAQKYQANSLNLKQRCKKTRGVVESTKMACYPEIKFKLKLG